MHKMCGETSSRPYSEKSKLNISLDQQSGVLYSLFLLCAQVEEYQNILKLRCSPPAFTLYKAILKNKKRSRTSLPKLFSSWFSKKNISHAIFC